MAGPTNKKKAAETKKLFEVRQKIEECRKVCEKARAAVNEALKDSATSPHTPSALLERSFALTHDDGTHAINASLTRALAPGSSAPLDNKASNTLTKEALETVGKLGLKATPSSLASTSGASMEAQLGGGEVDVEDQPFKAYCMSVGRSMAKENSSVTEAGVNPSTDHTSIAGISDTIPVSESVQSAVHAAVQSAAAVAAPTFAYPPSAADPFGLNPPRVLDPSVIEAVKCLQIVNKTEFNKEDGTFTMTLDEAITIIGPEHFEFHADYPRPVLRPSSIFRRQSFEAGLSREMWMWMCGTPVEEVVRFEGYNFEHIR